ncbi:MAG: Short-chain dehydrogenase/reductase SDR [Candidatus Curtissbacteria bacterium GW2011_GWA1_40_9]|uniref:Short-chain dehydrogenase/reductase SDR n=1 Tax=Candidatus Curtissbacteria bacterium GW2011_GWA1_40_9 TaxID=1618408 RepID=A0A0G0TN01_9BACT|nr:MAG: Short-chain dehydrogenase/reductase SDR [Candidatus Curtissbacteria bacterium GW2011_GWA1_40_9]
MPMTNIAVVTGAARGLGAYIVKSLASEGYTLVIHYKTSADDAKKILADIRKNSPDSIIVSADLTVENDVNKLFKNVISLYGRIDLLVNNVGNFLFKPFGKTSNSEFKDILESNIYSTILASRAVLPTMRKQGSGHIINIGAVGVERLIIRENSTPYFLAKTGIYVLTKAMAWEEAKHGIHVNMISPSSLKTDIFSASDFPMGRSAHYEDVYKVLAFLTSNDAYYINGANIEVSGAFVPGMV